MATRKSLSLSLSLSRIPPPSPHIRRKVTYTKCYSTTTTTTPDICDIVCIGGGPAGLSLLSALRSNPSTRNLDIVLIDSQNLTSQQQQQQQQQQISTHSKHFSNRCSSLTPSSLRFLQQNGGWEHVDPTRVQQYHRMEVWDGVSGSRIEFGAEEKKEMKKNLVEVATMCENSNLTTSLLRRLGQGVEKGKEKKQVEICDNTKVQSISLGHGPDPGPELFDGNNNNKDGDDKSPDLSQWPIVNLPTGRSLAARLLVGADGPNSPVRQFAGISSHGWDYNQHGIVATVELDQSLELDLLRAAYQRFLPTGPIALLPLPGNRASLVWSISAQYAPRIQQLPPAEFTAMVNAAFRLMTVDINYLLDNPTASPTEELSWREPNTPATDTGLPTDFPRITGIQNGSLASFPLRMRHASTYTGHRVALIGDAAHTVHPLAGQGLNLGLADAESLAKLIARGVEHGMDIGTCWCLDDYNSERWAANHAMLGSVDKLQKLYSFTSGPVVWGRSLGLDFVNHLGPVKAALMNAAAGR